jgi:hypothetical protein|tara:strand:- start:391 stop:1011 length:621 start_codon:yes stop_codon:yes gene_type:complete
MPFQSEKQRRYLWANEPEIARDWTDRYGARGGGIMRVPFGTGGNAWSWLLRALFNQGDDDKANWFQDKAQNVRGGIGDMFSRHYKPAPNWTPMYSQAGRPVPGQGYSGTALDRMNALGGFYSEPARAHRRMQKRQTNILNRAAADKDVGNVHLLGPNYGSNRQGGLSYTGPAPTQAQKEAGATTRQDKGWQDSSFRRGGIASLWPR